MDKVLTGLKTAWDWTLGAYHWTVDTIQEYPTVTFWSVVCLLVMLAVWRWR